MIRHFCLLVFLMAVTHWGFAQCNFTSIKEGKIEYEVRIDSIYGMMDYTFWDYGCAEKYSSTFYPDSIAFVLKVDQSEYTFSRDYKMVDGFKDDLKVFAYLKDNLNDKISSSPYRRCKILKKKCEGVHVDFIYDGFKWSGEGCFYNGILLSFNLNKEKQKEAGSNRYTVLNSFAIMAKSLELD